MRHTVKTDKCWKVNSARQGFPGGSDGKESASISGDLGSIPGRFPGEGNGNPLQFSCLENPMDRGILAWWATVRGAPQSRTRLSQ